MSVKVALLGTSENFSRSIGSGIPSYMYELARHFKELSKGSEFDISIVPCRRTSSELADFIGMAAGSLVKDYRRFDIVHNLDVKPLLPLNRGKALFVATAHDYQPLLAPELDADMLNGIKGRLRLALEIRYSLRLTLAADYIIARSTLTRDDAIRLGFRRKKIFVVGGAVDERYRKKLPSKEGRNTYTVGYIGAFRTRKNVAFAVRSFNKVNDNGIRFELWGRPAYEYEMLRKEAVNPNILFRGFAPEKRLVQIYDSFDAFVFPSLYEGLCLPILEAQARGLPVVICSAGRIPEETSKYCFKVRSEDEMARTIEHLKSNGYNEKQRKRAMSYARSFTWEKTAKDTLDVYKKILA